MGMATGKKALVLARKGAASMRRRFEDERLQAGAGSAGGGVAAAFIDRDEVRRVGDTVPLTLVIGLGGLALCALVKKLPLRGAIAGTSMGLVGAGSYVLAQEKLVPAEGEG